MTRKSIPGYRVRRFDSVGAARKVKDLHTPRQTWCGYGPDRCEHCNVKWAVDGCPERRAAEAAISGFDSVELWRRTVSRPQPTPYRARHSSEAAIGTWPRRAAA